MAGPSLRRAAEEELREIRAARAAKKESLNDHEFEVKSLQFMYQLHGDPEKQYEALNIARLCAELRRDLDELDEQLRRAKSVSDRFDDQESRASGARTEYSSSTRYTSSGRSSKAPSSSRDDGSRAPTSATRSQTSSRYGGRSEAGTFAGRRSEAQSSADYDDDESDDASTVKDYSRSRAPSSFGGRSEASRPSAHATGSRYTSHSYVSSQSSRNNDYPRESYTGRRREPGAFTGPSPLGSSLYPELRPGVDVFGSRRHDSPAGTSGFPDVQSGRAPAPRYDIRVPDGVRPATSGPEYPRQSYSSRARSPSGYSGRSYSTRADDSASQATYHYPPSMDPRSQSGYDSRSGSHRNGSSSRHGRSTSRAPPSTVYPGSSISNAQSRSHSYQESKRPRQEESRSYASRPSTREQERSTYTSDRESKKSRFHYQESAQSSRSHARTESTRPQSRHTEQPRGPRSTSTRQPPRSHAPAPLPSQSAIETWWKSVNAAFADYAFMQNFPAPPAKSCGKMDCEAQRGHRALSACDHGIKNCLIMVKDLNLKMERRRWHPDRFAVCPAAKREEFAKMAKEVFCVVEEMWKEKN